MRLRLRGRVLELRPGRPLLMGIVNASPDSFSDPGARGLDELVAQAHAQALAGAALIDVGGESGRTDRAPVCEAQEIERVGPVVERLSRSGLAVSVDTWRAPVARAALEAGAVMINDVSGLSDPGVAEACSETGAALVLTHTRLPPKHKGFPAYVDVLGDVLGRLRELMSEAAAGGVGEEQLVLDPGIDLAKSPADSIEVLRRLPELAPLARPLLVAASRKDFVGALTGRPPAARQAGTLAALGSAAGGGAAVLRVHDVGAASDFLAVRAALSATEPAPVGLELDEHLRREPA